MQKLEYMEALQDQQIKTVAKVAKEIWTQHFPAIIGADQTAYMIDKFQSYSAMKAQIAQEGYHYFLLCLPNDGQHTYIGYFGLRLEENSVFLSKLYIKQQYRGNRYASHAFQFMLGYANAYKKDRIWLTVNKYNHTTIAIYKKLGFQVFDSAVNDIGNGFVMDDYYMEYKIHTTRMQT